MGLFDSYKVKNMELKNRFVMAPMCIDAAIEGFANATHFVHYGARAQGGVGLIILEATAVAPNGRITEYDLGIWDDKFIDGLKQIVDYVHSLGAKIGIQLAHAGRKAELPGEMIVSAGSVAFSERYQAPHELTVEEIHQVTEQFAQAALRAKKAGFDVIEIHAAHGYLINQFLSPLTNEREDMYGSTLENRGRFLAEVVQAVRRVWTYENPLFVRFSAKEFDAQGNTAKEIAHYSNMIIEHIDMTHISSGGVINKKPDKVFPGYQLNDAVTVQHLTGKPAIAVGMLDSADLALYAHEELEIELIALGRGLLLNPNLVFELASEMDVDIEYPYPYGRARK